MLRNMRGKLKVLVIVGSTSSGKSALAVELARRFDGEVLSADSRQVYCGLDIGTGKIQKREMHGVRHHLIDVTSPKKQFSAADFLKRGHVAIEDVASRGKLPILAGGTGYYIDALVGRVVVPSVPPDELLRARLEKRSVKELFTLLKKKDPRRAATIEPQHKRRLIRALEIAAALGSSPMPSKDGSCYDVLWIGIASNPGELEKKIQVRLLARMKQGMVKEAQRLHTMGLSYKRMEEIGLEYRSLARFLQKKITRREMLEELRRDTRRYGKRQLRYWKRNNDIQWFPHSQKQKISRAVKIWLAA